MGNHVPAVLLPSSHPHEQVHVQWLGGKVEVIPMARASSSGVRGHLLVGGSVGVCVGPQDGNGAPIPDPRREFHPLGDENRIVLIPVGVLTGKNLSPSHPGEGAFPDYPSPTPVGAWQIAYAKKAQ